MKRLGSPNVSTGGFRGLATQRLLKLRVDSLAGLRSQLRAAWVRWDMAEVHRIGALLQALDPQPSLGAGGRARLFAKLEAAIAEVQAEQADLLKRREPQSG